MGQHVGVVSGINLNYCLNIVWHFLFSVDFFNHEHCSPLVGVVHNIPQMFNFLHVSPASGSSPLTNDEPVAQVSAFPDMWVNFLTYH